MYKKTSTKVRKQKNIENISDYKDHKIIHTFYKERSPNSVIIVNDINDPWFKYILTYKSKSGVIIDNYIIIESDLNTWIMAVERWGFKHKI
jgi:hypothetical protein